ncbi:MAG: TIGR01777 family oxidoreductase [Litorimonas sp.]
MSLTLWIFLALQMAMGALDTLYHHELTERLAWRESQAGELKLHSVRNAAYAVAFITLALFQPGGWFAIGLILLLVAEVGVTLRDFAEEDLTRKLPVTERLLHTLMTANYGVVLALLIPVLIEWSQSETALVPIWYGYWSLFLIAGAVAVTVFAARDFHAAIRLPRLHRRAPAALYMKGPRKTWLITGGTGFIGRKLVQVLQYGGNDIIVLTRNVETAQLPAPVCLVTDLDQIPAERRIDCVVNFAGEALAQGLWTKARKAEFRRSRIETTRALGRLFDRLHHRPTVLINGSAIGVYGIAPKGETDEFTPLKLDNSFSQKLCTDWEIEAEKLRKPSTRVVTLRIGMVLDRDGAALAQLLVPTELGGGATFGRGKTMMSWITRDDLVRMIQFAAIMPQIEGPLNGTAPTPASNREFTRAVAKALYRPTWLSIPPVFIRLMGGLGQEILLADQDIRPRKALNNGFTFLDADIAPALLLHLRAEPLFPTREKHGTSLPQGEQRWNLLSSFRALRLR